MSLPFRYLYNASERVFIVVKQNVCDASTAARHTHYLIISE